MLSEFQPNKSNPFFCQVAFQPPIQTHNIAGTVTKTPKSYLLNALAIQASGLIIAQLLGALCVDKVGACYSNSGTLSINPPLPQDDCTALRNLHVEQIKEAGSLFLDFQGVDGNNVTLALPLIWVAEQLDMGLFQCTGTSGNLVLGFHTFQCYYLVYDMIDETTTFDNLELSEETEDFIEGPELGGADPEPSAEYIRKVFWSLAICVFWLSTL